MIVYVYDEKTNEKLETFKHVNEIREKPNHFIVETDMFVKVLNKINIKIVIYGF